ncbi:MAG: hypothetical protein ACE5JZ_06875 [Kiloniellales bacterium]
MNRRAFLGSALILGAAVLASGHTPYRQWTVYRQRHLLILTSRTDAPSFPLGKRVAEVLAAHLPSSKARVTRAPYTRRIASLIATKQMDVAILARDDAASLFTGRGPFAEYGPVPLRTLIGLGDYLLVCRDDFPARHAYLVAATLSRNRDRLPVAVSAGEDSPPDATVPTHPGAQAFFEGRSPPGGGDGDD